RVKDCVASRGLAVIVAEQSAEACSPDHMTHMTTHGSLRRDESVFETLMIAFGMIMVQVLVDDIIEGAFTDHDHLLQGFLLDGTDDPFAVRIEMGTPRR